MSLSHVRWTWRGEIGISEGGSGAIGRAERLRCHHLAPMLALKAEKIKVMIKMTEKKKHPKEPLSGPGGEGAGQMKSGGNGTASALGVLDSPEEMVQLRGMGKDHHLRTNSSTGLSR